MPTNHDHAEAIIQTYATRRRNGGSVFMSYAEMADAIGRKGEHRLLGGPLDLVRDICVARGLPDIATVIVSKESLKSGACEPSKKAVEKYKGWPSLKAEQERVRNWNW